MKSTMEVTKRIEFECCYIQNHQIEAHRCKLEVTVEGPQRFEDFGRVITYENLQKYMKELTPHKTFLYCWKDTDSLAVAHAFGSAGCEVLPFEFEISAENLCSYFVKSLQDILDKKEPGITILEMKLREDNHSYVSWKRGNM